MRSLVQLDYRTCSSLVTDYINIPVGAERSSPLRYEVDYFNLTTEIVYTSDPMGVVQKLSPASRSDGMRDVFNTAYLNNLPNWDKAVQEHIIVRYRYFLSGHTANHFRDFFAYSRQDVDGVQGQLMRVFRDNYGLTPQHNQHNCQLDVFYLIPLAQLYTDRRVFDQRTKTLFTLDNPLQQGVCLPNPIGYDMAHAVKQDLLNDALALCRDPITGQSSGEVSLFSALTIVDNENGKRKLFVRMLNTTHAIETVQDPNRTNGVYWLAPNPNGIKDARGYTPMEQRYEPLSYVKPENGFYTDRYQAEALATEKRSEMDYNLAQSKLEQQARANELTQRELERRDRQDAIDQGFWSRLTGVLRVVGDVLKVVGVALASGLALFKAFGMKLSK